MPVDPRLSRRTFLCAGLCAGAGTVLAACSSGGGSTATAPPGTSTGTSSSGPVPLARLSDIPVGEAVSTDINGQPALIARTGTATAAAYSAICPHTGGTVVPDGKQLRCTRHGSIFTVATGDVVSGPAPRGLDSFDVSVRNGEVFTG